ncbi:coiled-coil domain-containing protein 57-like [Sinocyclocheilus grahami]|uniref:coiled-coil domain-containing protein 57-like n=1 Tax=Sinocyclocheilus grahami TaxID=75366 RepID=UPI0007AD409B|nr:PREDICTED: coiled-coil domain-containing protein 57-like [Sinocyclocheilus grahami]
MVKQLQEENLSMRQQLLLLQSSARAGTVGDVATLQSKLKQAARLISSLSQDKQQLIEMGNRLRAQLIEAGLEGPRHSKITLKPNDPEHSLVEKEPSQSEHGVQPKSRLSTLEQLQYQLTTQELQYAQRDQNKKMAIIVRPQFSESESSDKRRTANPWEPPIRVQSVGSKENTPPQNQSEAPVPLPGSSHFLLSPIGADDSLQNVWKMLDQGLSSSVFSTSDSEDKGRVATANRGHSDINQPPAAPVSVEGTKASLQEKKKPNQTTFASAKKTRPAGNKSKIRNYNIKD